MKIKIFIFLFGTSFIFYANTHADVWRQTNWSGGSGQTTWLDSTMYFEGSQVNGVRIQGDLRIDYPAWIRTGDLIGARDVLSLIEGYDQALYAGTSSDAKVFKSTNWGFSWDTTGTLFDIFRVRSLLQGSDSALYAGTSVNGDVYRSTDWGASWQNTDELVNVSDVNSLIEAFDGTFYAGVGSPVYGKVIFKSTNNGASWDTTGDLDSARFVYSLIQSSDGSLYAGTGFGFPQAVFKSTNSGFTWTKIWDSLIGNVLSLIEGYDGALYAGGVGGYVYKSTDGGVTWFDTGAINPRWGIPSLLQASDSTIYAGSIGNIYKSRDYGITWIPTEPLPSGRPVEDIIEASDGHLYAGLLNDRVYKSSFFTSGNLVSSIFDTGDWGAIYGIMSWSSFLFDQSLVMKVRTSPDSLMAGAVPWGNAPSAISGQDISSLSSVNDGDRYVQYRVELYTLDLDVTPVLYEVRVFFSPVGVEEISEVGESKSKIQLLQNYPNPFPHSTIIQYNIPNSANVTLLIYDLTGRFINELIEEKQKVGKYSVSWDGKNLNGEIVSNGVYFYQLELGSGQRSKKFTKKMIKLY
jgi:photosystem II stability/assembly factor-like uncharacterized protein